MASIASFGGVVFEISEDRKLFLMDFERTESSRWVDHELLMVKPQPNFLGAGLVDLRFQIILKAQYGVNPDVEMSKLRTMNRRGRTDYFIRGKKSISVNRFSIRSIQESHRRIDNLGNVLEIYATMSLKEDPTRINKKKQSVSAVKASNPAPKPNRLGKITITTKSVHIRSGPSVKNKVLGYAMKGDELVVISVKNGWYSLGSGKYITANSAYSTLKKG